MVNVTKWLNSLTPQYHNNTIYLHHWIHGELTTDIKYNSDEIKCYVLLRSHCGYIFAFIHSVSVFSGHRNSSFYVKSSVSPDNQFLATGSSDHHAYIWKVRPLVTCDHVTMARCVAPAGEVRGGQRWFRRARDHVGNGLLYSPLFLPSLCIFVWSPVLPNNCSLRTRSHVLTWGADGNVVLFGCQSSYLSCMVWKKHAGSHELRVLQPHTFGFCQCLTSLWPPFCSRYQSQHRLPWCCRATVRK